MPDGGVDVVSHLGLGLRLARRRWWMHRILPREDYEQEAMLALVLAAEKYRSGSAAKFATFAYPCINGALINAERAWMGYSRREKTGPQFEPMDEEVDVEFVGMCEANFDSVARKYDGEWFARPARMVLLSGLSVLDAARLCNCKPNTVHQSVSYFRKRLTAELAA